MFIQLLPFLGFLSVRLFKNFFGKGVSLTTTVFIFFCFLVSTNLCVIVDTLTIILLIAVSYTLFNYIKKISRNKSLLSFYLEQLYRLISFFIKVARFLAFFVFYLLFNSTNCQGSAVPESFISCCYSFAASNPGVVGFVAAGLGCLTLGLAGFWVTKTVPPKLPSLLEKAINYTPLQRPYPDLTDAKHLIKSFKQVTEGLAYGEMPDHYYSNLAKSAKKISLWADKASPKQLADFLERYENEVLAVGGSPEQVHNFINNFASSVYVEQSSTWVGWFLAFFF